MYTPTGFDGLTSLIDDLETQITVIQLPQPQAATITTITHDTFTETFA